MLMTVPTSEPPAAQPERLHPSWCARDEAPGRSHRSQPRIIPSNYGFTTRIYLDQSDTSGVTVLTIEQDSLCFDSDHAEPGHECADTLEVIGMRMPEARRFLVDLLELFGATEDETG